MVFVVGALVLYAGIAYVRLSERASRRATFERTRPHFVSVGEEAGLVKKQFCGGRDKDHILESVGSGAAFIDYNNDGLLDLYLVNGWLLEEDPSQVAVRGRNMLYRNIGGGRFEDVSQEASVDDDRWGCGVCAGDFDGDGLIDLYVTNFGPNTLYRNTGRGRFEEVGARARVDDAGWGAGCAFFDADRDGDLDLYVANYIECTLDDVLSARRTTLWQQKVNVMTGPFGLPGGRDRYFRNQGDGTFQDFTVEAGMADMAEGYGLGVVASDLDSDGDVDIYVANDSNPNYLYRNEGEGLFTEIGLWSGAGYSADGAAQAGMGVDAADLDGDGLQELVVTNFASDHCTLYRNMRNCFFEDVSAASGIKEPTHHVLSWGCAFLDFDLDTDLDLFIANGHIYPQVDTIHELRESYAQLPILFESDNGSFTDVSRLAGPGMQERLSARGLAVGDYDDDGDLDLLLTAIDSPPVLLRNDTPSHQNWVKIRLMKQDGGYAMNAVATISTHGVVQMREVRSGSTYQSQNALDLHFGLGSSEKIESLEVRWPNGTQTSLRDVGARRTIELAMPET